MTLKEFMQGWMLLTAQPWGRPYRQESTVAGREPSAGEIQAELYFQTVRTYHGESWQRACVMYARGERWPSLDAIIPTMELAQSPVLKLAAPDPPGVSMEEALKERPDLVAMVKRVMT